MGMYTELHYNAELAIDTPAEVIAVLRHMLGAPDRPANLPDHPLFQTKRWPWMLRGESAYFIAETRSTMAEDVQLDDRVVRQLSIQCSLQNEGDEIQKFIDWLAPYAGCYRGQFLGFYRYEETDTPTLIHATRGGD